MQISTEYQLGFLAGSNFNSEDAFDNDRLLVYLQPEDFCDVASTLAYKQGFLRGYFGSMYKAPYTINQIETIRQLHKKDLFFIASEFLKHWYNGATYYIDSRIDVSSELCDLVQKANKEAVKSVW